MVYVSIFLCRPYQVSVPICLLVDAAKCVDSIANAKVAGMMKDLHLSSGEYSLAIIIFFIPYILFEIPSNLILSKTRPSVYLPTIMILWGAVACCMGAVKNVHGLLAVRFVLGLLEAGFAPGVSLVLSSWYKRAEQAKRFSAFYSAAVLSGALGGIIAGAITGSLDGARGIAGWRWLFVRRTHCLYANAPFH
jgi:MFS family permease